ncbi:MAG: exodeoxyribonuclease VII large subunit [Pseudomonadota bacterium]
MESNAKDILSVSGLNRSARALLEREFGTIWVEGEVSNLARPASGHLYFSLKDRNAQVRCAFFRQRQRGLATTIESGDQVLVRAKLSLYEPRGDYQLIVEHAEPAGQGALQKQFEILKAKLAAEGLFNESRKQALPETPAKVGLITSASGAALRDVLNVLKRRMPSVDVIIYASAVQGAEAPESLRRALHKATYRNEVDTLIITRGGGSIEDLAAFNDEALARAIADCDIPVISGVGHEIDFTIADFVADLRAPTPSAAAELAVPDSREIVYLLANQRRHLRRLVSDQLERIQQSADQLSRRLKRQNPALKVRADLKRLAISREALARSLPRQLDRLREKQAALQYRLGLQSPSRRLALLETTFAAVRARLKRVPQRLLEPRRVALASAARALHAVSPLATLDRGYAIVTSDTSKEALTDVATTSVGERVNLRLSKGSLSATVDAIEDESS